MTDHPHRFDYIRDPGEIVRRSFEIIVAEAALSDLPDDIAPLATRIVHACGMTDILDDLVHSPGAGALGRAALAAGAPVVCDVAMVAAGIAVGRLPAGNEVRVAVSEHRAAETARRLATTRTAAGIDCLADRLEGAVVVIGNAPTALFRVLELAAEAGLRPALVLGFPVGFVGAAEAKEALAGNRLGLPLVALRGRRGGSAIAAAALNALLPGAEPS